MGRRDYQPCAADATVSAMFTMIISGGKHSGAAQKLTDEAPRGWSGRCCKSEGKLRDDQKMLALGESAAGETNTHTTARAPREFSTRCTWSLLIVRTLPVWFKSVAHYTLQSFNLPATWSRSGTSVAAPRLLGNAGQPSHAVWGHPELD